MEIRNDRSRRNNLDGGWLIVETFLEELVHEYENRLDPELSTNNFF